MSFQFAKNKKEGPVFMLAAIAVALVVVFIGSTAGPAIAGRDIHKIRPIGEMQSHGSNLRAWEYFDLVGILNSVNGNQVTIGDRQLTLAPGVGTSGMSQYNVVGANLNRAGEVVELELVSNDPS